MPRPTGEKMVKKITILAGSFNDGKCDHCGDSELVKAVKAGILKNTHACVNCREMAKGYR